MKINILDKAKKKRFIEELEGFGLARIPELLIKVGNEKVRAFSGNLSKEEIMEIWRAVPMEGIGLYVGKERVDRRNGQKETSLSLDGINLWKDQITKRFLKLNEAQEEEWFYGENVELDEGQSEGVEGFVVVVSADGKDFIGTGKIGDAGKTLYCFLPKERRRKKAVIG